MRGVNVSAFGLIRRPMKQALNLHFRPNAGAQHVDRGEGAALAHMPEGPAIAGRRALNMGAHLVDRAGLAARDHRAVRAHLRGATTLRAIERITRFQQSRFNERTKGNPRQGALGLGDLQQVFAGGVDGGDALARHVA